LQTNPGAGVGRRAARQCADRCAPAAAVRPAVVVGRRARLSGGAQRQRTRVLRRKHNIPGSVRSSE
jgi:hypothetical protein